MRQQSTNRSLFARREHFGSIAVSDKNRNFTLNAYYCFIYFRVQVPYTNFIWRQFHKPYESGIAFEQDIRLAMHRLLHFHSYVPN